MKEHKTYNYKFKHWTGRYDEDGAPVYDAIFEVHADDIGYLFGKIRSHGNQWHLYNLDTGTIAGDEERERLRQDYNLSRRHKYAEKRIYTWTEYILGED